MKTQILDEEFCAAKKRSAFKAEALALQVISSVWDLMKKKNLSKSALAQLMGKNPAYVNRVLNGPHNITIRTIAEFASALDGEIKFQIADSSLIDAVTSFATFESAPIQIRSLFHHVIAKSANDNVMDFDTDAISESLEELAA